MPVSQTLFYVHLLFVGVTSNVVPDVVSSLSSPSASTTRSECRCVPDQWEGTLTITEHEVDVSEGRHIQVKSSVLVHYDFRNKRMATDDIIKGLRSIADYAKGVTYVIDGNGCRSIETSAKMQRMCFPGDITSAQTTTIGSRLPVNIWKSSAPDSVAIRTVATRDRCVPISEEIVDSQTDYLSLITTLYTGVTLGIQDVEVFRMPTDCRMQSNQHFGQVHSNPRDRRSVESRGQQTLLNQVLVKPQH